MNEKHAAVAGLIDDAMVTLVIDSTQLGVDVPEQLRQRDLTLNFKGGDTVLNSFGLTATLSFGKMGLGFQKLVIPWSAVYALKCGTHTQLWPEPPPPPKLQKRLGGIGLLCE